MQVTERRYEMPTMSSLHTGSGSLRSSAHSVSNGSENCTPESFAGHPEFSYVLSLTEVEALQSPSEGCPKNPRLDSCRFFLKAAFLGRVPNCIFQDSVFCLIAALFHLFWARRLVQSSSELIQDCSNFGKQESSERQQADQSTESLTQHR